MYKEGYSSEYFSFKYFKSFGLLRKTCSPARQNIENKGKKVKEKNNKRILGTMEGFS